MSVDHKRIAAAMKVRLENCPEAKARRCDAMCADCPNVSDLDRVYEGVKHDVTSVPEYMFRATPVKGPEATLPTPSDYLRAIAENPQAFTDAGRRAHLLHAANDIERLQSELRKYKHHDKCNSNGCHPACEAS